MTGSSAGVYFVLADIQRFIKGNMMHMSSEYSGVNENFILNKKLPSLFPGS